MGIPATISDLTLEGLNRALDGTQAQMAATARNIANADTPGYIPTHVQFGEQLAAALQRAHKAARSRAYDARGQTALERLRPLEIREQTTPMKRDQNGVDIEREITDLARVSLQNRAILRLLGRKLAMLQTAIAQGGGR